MVDLVPSRKRASAVFVAVLAALALVAAACGGGDGEGGGGGGTGEGASGTPTRGGEVVYGLEADNTNGWCLYTGQLAISGIQVARGIYDTLTAPDEDGGYEPYLAKSVTPNDTFTEWTIVLRDGVTFHDGSPLDAEVVKANLDAYRGPTALLFQFVFDNISDVQVVDPMTVKVLTETPWPSLPAFLFASGRVGIMAQAQLDSPDCATELIGTGPFKQDEWRPGESYKMVRNDDYWQTDADGEQLPYLDAITFRPFPDANTRMNALSGGEINAMHASGAEQIDLLRADAESGEISLVESDAFPEVAYGMLNVSKPPFDNKNARLALAYGLDRDTFNEVRNLDLFTMASGPFGEDEIGYLEDAGFPEYDPDKAREYAAKFQEETGLPLEFTLISIPDPSTVQSAQFFQESARKFGVDIQLRTLEQSQLISTAISGDFEAMVFRNHPGGDPDQQYVWWKGGMPTNLGRFDDPEINRLLDEGRASADPEAREQIYADINRRFGSEVYNIWLNWTQWDIAGAPGLGGVYGPNLPDETGKAGSVKPFPGLATGHPVHGLYLNED
jgi:peptide/nickel transport system substrate-binding protein